MKKYTKQKLLDNHKYDEIPELSCTRNDFCSGIVLVKSSPRHFYK